jgi:hypothetical protein
VIEVDVKQVFTTLEELVDPSHTALVAVDMRRDFCTPVSAFDRLGVDITMYPPMVPRLVGLVEGSPRRGGPARPRMLSIMPQVTRLDADDDRQ